MIKVITVNYKQEKYIQKLVDSLDDDVELYIVDNSGELIHIEIAYWINWEATSIQGYYSGKVT